MSWTRESWSDASGCGQEEAYLVAAIKKHLLTAPQRRRLYELDLTIEDLLNGRVEGDQSVYTEMFSPWNDTLGWREFGSG